METTLEASIDAHIIAGGFADTNYGTLTTIAVGHKNGTAYTFRSLVKFDLSSLSGKRIHSARLRLTYASDESGNERTGYVYRVKRNWTEAGVTWNKYNGTSSWSTAGCGSVNDRETTEIGTWTQPASPTANTTVDITLSATAIQEMIDGTFTNYGFLLKVDTESNDKINYHSSEAATATYRPTLIVGIGGGTVIILSED
jgi:hypothetical protein